MKRSLTPWNLTAWQRTAIEEPEPAPNPKAAELRNAIDAAGLTNTQFNEDVLGVGGWGAWRNEYPNDDAAFDAALEKLADYLDITADDTDTESIPDPFADTPPPTEEPPPPPPFDANEETQPDTLF